VYCLCRYSLLTVARQSSMARERARRSRSDAYYLPTSDESFAQIIRVVEGITGVIVTTQLEFELQLPFFNEVVVCKEKTTRTRCGIPVESVAVRSGGAERRDRFLAK